jgi:ribosomal protein S18 acetylase RimI-like enzyme
MIADIRPYRAEDLESLYEIALATGDAGQDASALYRDPKLVGHVYAGPYGVLEPSGAFVLEDARGVGGYIIGAVDTRTFEAALEERWWPDLRPLYADPSGTPREAWDYDQRLSYLIHHPARTPGRVVEAYPAHLHIDMLPRLQGLGFGKALLDRWFQAMRQAGAKGAHLGVGSANQRAIRFYRAYGLAELPPSGEPPTQVLWFAKALTY